jgi:hypothetical protein
MSYKYTQKCVVLFLSDVKTKNQLSLIQSVSCVSKLNANIDTLISFIHHHRTGTCRLYPVVDHP